METLEEISTETLPVYVDEASPPRLRFWPAAAVFFLYVAVQMLAGFAGGIAGTFVADFKGYDLQDPQVISEVTQSIMVPASAIGMIFSGLLVIIVSIWWFRGELKDQSATGAAWVIGGSRKNLAAFSIGILIAILYLVIAPVLHAIPEVETMGPLAKMASRPGISQTVWILLALLLAPPIEELLFRGVLFGGICRSWGPVAAGLVTTVVFVLMHVPEMMHYWPALIFITIMAAVALRWRLTTGAIGSSVAVHLGYNSVLVGSVLMGSV